MLSVRTVEKHHRAYWGLWRKSLPLTMTNTSERQTVLQSTAGFHWVTISKRNSGAFKPGPDIWTFWIRPSRSSACNCLQRDPVGQFLTDKRTSTKHARFCLMQAEVVIVIKKKTFGNQKYKFHSEIWRGVRCCRNTTVWSQSGKEELPTTRYFHWNYGTLTNQQLLIYLYLFSRSRSVGSVFGNIPKLIGHIKW